jgi:acyl transferase domain-containing protein/acyl carrier protein
VENLKNELKGEDVAVIAMTCTFPGATSIYKYWDNIKNGVESITRFSREELLKAGIPDSTIDNPRYVPARGIIDDIEYFDAEFFGYSPSEAEVMDPQHRVFMEHAWQALETAGYYSDSFKGQIGIFAGSGHNSYMLTNLWPHRSLSGHAPMLEIAIGNDKDHLATRVAYKLNLKGPALSIQTTCSTSLVAISVAVQNLLTGNCDIALAGGVSVSVPATRGYLYHQGGILSPDGHCRTFDTSAKGTVFGNGVGVVVLKRLSDALADRDTILSVIKGVAINNDGAVKVGYTAPSIEGQAKVIAKAQAIAGVSPESIGYVEAHGTGTQLGDPIELTALNEAFRLGTEKKQFCAIGSVKSNLGHLNGAAGVAGFIKTVMAVREGKLPPSLHFETPNPQIPFADSPFYVSAKLADWPESLGKRLAGVSSFGIGGTNAHVVIEEPPTLPAAAKSERPWSILPISARTETALAKAAENMAQHLTNAKNQSLADIAYTMQVGRKAFSNRLAIVSNDVESAALTLRDSIGSGTTIHAGQRRIAFVFPGQGSQVVGATRHIYRQERIFREAMDQCCDLFAELIDVDLRHLLYAENEKQTEAQEKLNETAMAQPAIFSICYALAALWSSWGISPTSLLGHSIGEYVAACISGIFSLEDAIAIVAARSRLMQSLPHGTMISMSVVSSECKKLISQSNLGLDLALVNGENSCVVSGTREAIAGFQEFLTKVGIESHRLRTSHAFHSRMMDPILSEFEEAFAKVPLHKPSIPVVSNVTGTWLTDEDAIDPKYWARHLRQAVQFDAGIETLLEGGCDIVLEVGAGQSMSALLKQHRALASDQIALSSLPHVREIENESFILATCVASLWRMGAPLNWQAYNGDETLGRVPLPTYPFEKKRFWIEPKNYSDPPKSNTPTRTTLADSLYTLNWKRLTPLKDVVSDDLKNSPKTWLILADRLGVAASLSRRLSELGHKAIIVDSADAYRKLDGLGYQINPENSEDYKKLLEDLHRNQMSPDHVMHLWGITSVEEDLGPEGEAHGISCFFSMLWLMQAVSSQGSLAPLHVCVATTGLYEVDGRDKVNVNKSILAGPCSVIPLEFSNISCRLVDIQPPTTDNGIEKAANDLLKEVCAWTAESIVALRDIRRWSCNLEKTTIEMPQGGSVLRKQGVYLITGGTSGIGLVLAEHLARTQQARLILTGRRALPSRDDWKQCLADPDTEKSTSYLLQKVMEMELAGAQVELRSVDVCNQDKLAELIAETYAKWGTLNGVIHSAGVPGGGVIALKSRDEAERVLAPKLTGTKNLIEILKHKTLDFIALCSSLDAIRGLDGQVDYAAANAYLDAVARASSIPGTLPIVSINWPTWREVGMSVSVDVPEAMKAKRRELLNSALTNAEGIEAFERILASPYEQVIVAPTGVTLPTTKRLGSSQPDTPQIVPAIIKKPTRTLHPRPQLANPYLAPENEIEEQLVGIWQELLGIERIGTKDNFFALGGHSLMAVRLTFRVREHFKIEYPLQDLFGAPTIFETAELIMLKYAGELDPNELVHLLNDIESLSPEELRNTLALQ